MTGVVGHSVTLDYPELGNDVINENMLAIKDWFQGPVSDPDTHVSRLMTRGDHVIQKYTVDKRMGINSMDGDLIIQNLTLRDAGFYTCYFSGSKLKNIQLNVITGKMLGSIHNMHLIHSCNFLAYHTIPYHTILYHSIAYHIIS